MILDKRIEKIKPQPNKIIDTDEDVYEILKELTRRVEELEDRVKELKNV